MRQALAMVRAWRPLDVSPSNDKCALSPLFYDWELMPYIPARRVGDGGDAEDSGDCGGTKTRPR